MRLGYNSSEEIKEHPFFAGVDWIRMSKKQVEVPFKPKISGEFDLGQIDEMFKKEVPAETPEDTSYLNTENKFDDFTY